MRLKDAMRKDTGACPGPDVVGVERQTWYHVGTLRSRSGTISVADRGAISADNSIRGRTAIGACTVEAMLIDFDGSLFLSRIRVRTADSNPKPGRKLGSLSVDLGGVVFVDFQSMATVLSDEEIDEFNDLAPGCQAGIATIDRLKFERLTVKFVVCQSGFGDGTYPVYALRSGTKPAGIEVAFVRDGTKYGSRY